MLYRLLALLLLISQLGAAPAPVISNYGWVKRPQDVELTALKTIKYKDQLKDLIKYNDDSDSFNYRFLYRVLDKSGQLSSEEKSTQRLTSLNQGQVGSCVGYATTRALDIVAAANVLHRQQLNESWFFPFNPDAIYGIGRQKNLDSSDGSTGAWSITGLREIGTLHKTQYGSIDLTNTRPEQGRAWAARKMPTELLTAAGDHKVNASAQVKTPEEVKAAIQNGYAVIVCAQASYGNQRDTQGFSKRTGDAWAHAMAVVAYRGQSSGKEGFLIQNSWGDTWNNGPVYPNDQPHGSFWVTPTDLQYHLSQGDSWALAGYEGFKFRKISWKDAFDVGGTPE